MPTVSFLSLASPKSCAFVFLNESLIWTRLLPSDSRQSTRQPSAEWRRRLIESEGSWPSLDPPRPSLRTRLRVRRPILLELSQGRKWKMIRSRRGRRVKKDSCPRSRRRRRRLVGGHRMRTRKTLPFARQTSRQRPLQQTTPPYLQLLTIPPYLVLLRSILSPPTHLSPSSARSSVSRLLHRYLSPRRSPSTIRLSTTPRGKLSSSLSSHKVRSHPFSPARHTQTTQ
jgi:hypothetical protein